MDTEWFVGLYVNEFQKYNWGIPRENNQEFKRMSDGIPGVFFWGVLTFKLLIF